jgi:ribosomal protein S18 acetylase RimI-like enzyme
VPDVTLTYLEMLSAHQLRPCARPGEGDLVLARAEIPSPEFSRFLYTAVGSRWGWKGRRRWTYAQWREYLDRPELETWVGYVSATPIGYGELEWQEDGNVELCCFGLLPQFLGRGLGGPLLTKVVQRSWARLETRRVWLHTYSGDHPSALPNYRARGFEIFRTETRPGSPSILEPWPGAFETLSVSLERPDVRDVAPLLDALDRHLAALYPSESNHLLSLEALQAPDVRFFVARRGREAIGCGALRVCEGYGEIKRMYVHPEARGGRVGRALLAHLEDAARGLGLPVLRLETGVHQPEAIALYRATGYRDRGPFGTYGADPLSIFMEKTLA